MTKSVWLKGLIQGEIGLQSGNTNQRWRYNSVEGKFQVKHSVRESWEYTNINTLDSSREFSFAIEEEMTLQQVCKELGRDIKIVQ